RRREIECPRPALSSALTSCAVVSFLRKRCHNEELQATLINTLSAVLMPPRITTSNLDLRAHLASGASISMFCASLDLFLPVMAKSSPCYRPVPRAPPIFLKLLLSKLIFLQKPVRRPPILPVSCLLSGSIRAPSPSSTRA